MALTRILEPMRDLEEDCKYDMTESRVVLQVLDILTARHGKVVRETFREAAVKKWSQDTFSHGAFVMEGVEQRPLLQVRSLAKSHPRS